MKSFRVLECMFIIVFGGKSFEDILLEIPELLLELLNVERNRDKMAQFSVSCWFD